MFEYLGGTLRGMDAHSHETGGVADHVHLVVSLKPTHMISKVLQELKKASSTWMHEEMRVQDFAWQDGYAAFTVSASALPEVISYVRDQEEHHRTRSFREELEIMLKNRASALIQSIWIEERQRVRWWHHHPPCA